MTTTLELITCCNTTCGIQFAAPEHWVTQRRRDHSWWYCPNGHNQHFPDESDVTKAQRLQRESELKAQAQINEERHLRVVAENERDKAVRAKRKIEKRIRAGVCPCCNRTFGDLHRHMTTKHKEYGLPPGKDAKQLTGAA